MFVIISVIFPNLSLHLRRDTPTVQYNTGYFFPCAILRRTFLEVKSAWFERTGEQITSSGR